MNQLEISHVEIEQILNSLNLTLKDKQLLSFNSRMASNFIISTHEKERVLIKIYHEERGNKLETGNIHFEVAALRHLKNQGINVPDLLMFENDRYILNLINKTIIAYVFIAGTVPTKNQLSVITATLSGEFLASMIKAAENFNIDYYKHSLPTGDIDHIISISKLKSRDTPNIHSSSIFEDMLNVASDKKLKNIMAKSPQGIVHADFFFENFIVNDKESSVIDFNDAYYGSIVMDVAIGAMEFSAVSEKEWNFDYLNLFLKPIKPWLIHYKFTADDLIILMQINCLRFAIYTYEPQYDENFDHNSYVQRFKYLSQANIQRKIKSVFKSIL